MNDPIPPALTADEWAECSTQLMMHVGSLSDTTPRPVQLTFMPGEGIGFWGVRLRPGQPVHMAEDCAQVFLAAANHALPENSRYKITRADVLTLFGAANYVGADPELKRIASKLAALLPPE